MLKVAKKFALFLLGYCVMFHVRNELKAWNPITNVVPTCSKLIQRTKSRFEQVDVAVVKLFDESKRMAQCFDVQVDVRTA